MLQVMKPLFKGIWVNCYNKALLRANGICVIATPPEFLELLSLCNLDIFKAAESDLH